MNSTDERSDEGSDVAQGKRQIGGELIIPVSALVFTLYYISTVINSPWTAQVNAFLIGSILIVLTLVFFGFAAREMLAGRATLGMSNLLAPRHMLVKRAIFILMTVAYFVAMPWLGFTLATFAFLAGSMLLLGGTGKWIGALVSSGIMAAIGYGVFIVLFGKRLPTGPIEYLLQGLS